MQPTVSIPLNDASGPYVPQTPRAPANAALAGRIKGGHQRGDVVLDGLGTWLGCASRSRSAQRAAPGARLGHMAGVADASSVSNLGQATAIGSRKNFFGNEVIFKRADRQGGGGYADNEFLAELGSKTQVRFFKESVSSAELARMASRSNPEFPGERRMCVATLRRRAEQEFILQGMYNGGLLAVAGIAREYGKGIATRPTALAAHMAIESGAPTKPQEFKNKTAKEEDIWLCDELNWDDIGKVVHYDPSVGWTSTGAAEAGKPASPLTERVIETRWQAKWETIQARARRSPGMRLPPKDKLRDAFYSRIKEYAAEDSAYRGGELSDIVLFAGPRLRLKVRPDADIFGDHDLFAFTDAQGRRMVPEDARVQAALQGSHAFQAQHGGIWYWQPGRNETFNQGIKAKIMAGHSPSSDAPLILAKPDGEVTAVFHVADKQGDPSGDRLESVWKHKQSTKWLESTPSGKLLAGLRSSIRNIE
jgi:hypothetical protein